VEEKEDRAEEGYESYRDADTNACSYWGGETGVFG